MLYLYVVPDIEKVSGGPRARISNFKKEFLVRDYKVIEGRLFNKLKLSLRLKKKSRVYIESATNRISLADLICLIIIRLKTGKIIVFIRDIYIELFPEQYKGIRKSITKLGNKFSNWFYLNIAAKIVFPTENMGHYFFKANPTYPAVPYYALPPGCANLNIPLKEITNTRAGICYMGGIGYQNSGIENFLNFAKLHHSDFNFFLLSQDIAAVKKLLAKHDLTNVVEFKTIPYQELNNYFNLNNIKFGFHSRNRSTYDDITFPIKILDYLSLEIPVISDFHDPIVKLLGVNYPLFTPITDYKKISEILHHYLDSDEYGVLLNYIKSKKVQNLYSSRIAALEEMF